jgi:hypothetical protein
MNIFIEIKNNNLEGRWVVDEGDANEMIFTQ